MPTVLIQSENFIIGQAEFGVQITIEFHGGSLLSEDLLVLITLLQYLFDNVLCFNCCLYFRSIVVNISIMLMRSKWLVRLLTAT